MRNGWAIWIAVAALLAGCAPKPAAELAQGAGARGRYVGIGIFSPGRIWAQLVGEAQTKDPKSARLEDDEQVIVVMDSTTGEVRQCGNLSGVCVSMSPWAAPVATGHVAPVLLQKHASELTAEAEAAARPAAAPAQPQPKAP